MAKLGMLKNIRARTGTRDSGSVLLTVRDIPVGDISIKGNVRGEYTGIEELAASIRQHGLLQPITVYAEGDGFIVKTGHRRYMAYRKLYGEEPERYHRIRCMVSDGKNAAVIQLVENVQRVDLSQRELCDALITLRKQGFTLNQIADVMGKTEKYIKNLFVGINEIVQKEELQLFIDSPAGGTIQDIAETKGIDEPARVKLLEQRKRGVINRADLRKKVKELKSPKSEVEYPLFPKTERIKIRMRVFFNLREIVVFPDKTVSGKQLNAIGKDLQAFFNNSEAYDLEIIAPEPAAAKPQRKRK